MKKHRLDYWLLASVVVLLVLGILILASVSAIFSQKRAGTTTYFLVHQLVFGLLPGLVLGFIVFKIPLLFLKKIAPVLILANLLLMALVFVPKIGITAGGASRWINLGFTSFQPSEFLKLVFILYLSVWLASRTNDIGAKKNWQTTLIPFLMVVGVVALLLLLQSDLSTLGIIISVAVLMYFSAKTPLWHTLLVCLGFVAALAAFIIFEPYRWGRLLVLLDLASDPTGIGYQMNQALIAVGSGSLFGLGLGASNQTSVLIPQTTTDSIFAIFSRELGFVGVFVLIAFFLILLWRGLKIAKNSRDRFAQLLSLGIVSWICIQAFFNMGANIGIMPLAGIPLPFVSYGGSHIITELIGIGLLLNISRNKKN